MPLTSAYQLTPIENAFNAILTEAKAYADSLAVARPHARRVQSSAQTLSNSSATIVTNFGTAQDTQYGVTYANGDWTVTEAGVYTVSASVGFASNSTGYRRVYIHAALSGAATAEQRRSTTNAVSGQESHVPIALTIRLAANDVINLRALQTSGGNLATDPTMTTMSVSWVSP